MKPISNTPDSAKEGTIRVAIVDDDERIRGNFARIVDGFPDCECVGDFSSGKDALAGIRGNPPDVMLMDINMPEMSGIECARQLKDEHPLTEIIMLTVYQDTDSVFQSLAAGASGYLLKRADRKELLNAIRQVHSGGSPMTSHIARKVVQAFRAPAAEPEAVEETEKLSPREQEVLALLAEGYLYKEIADTLSLSYETVHNYIRRVYEKLRVRSRGQAVAKYFSQKRSQGDPPGRPS
jgi:DNA-binding NarL/FixJ family response regulator